MGKPDVSGDGSIFIVIVFRGSIAPTIMVAYVVLLFLSQSPVELSGLPPPPLVSSQPAVEFSPFPAAPSVEFSPPPLVKLETFVAPPLVRVDEPPQVPAPAVNAAPNPGPTSNVVPIPSAQSTPSAQSLFELTRRHSQLSLEIASFDTSGPGWAQALRVVGYVLILPAVIFMAPVISGNSVVAGTTSAISGSTTLTPTFNTIGLALVVTCGVALALGIGFGVAGWISKTFELNALKDQRSAIEVELSAAHGSARP